VRAAIGAAAVAVLLLIGWGGYAFIQHMLTTVEQTVQQREAELKAEWERQARAAAEAGEKRKAEEAEQQRLAAVKAEQERQARAAAAKVGGDAATAKRCEDARLSDSDVRSCYETAAGLGNANAMFGLGALYEDGHHVNRDPDQARKWYQKAADAGYEPAKEKLKTLPSRF
jgi:TPR repeat protein